MGRPMERAQASGAGRRCAVTTWLPVLLAVVLVAVEARRLMIGQLRRERWRALLARSTEVHLGQPWIFMYSIGQVVGFGCQGVATRKYVVKIDYRAGKLWCADA